MKKRGVGYGSMFYGLGYGFSRTDIASATLALNQDGSIIARSGEVEYGQGSDTVFCQIIAEELGVDYIAIKLITADTDVTPDSGPTSASRLTFVGGNAFIKVSRSLKKLLHGVAEEILGESDLVFREGMVFSRSDPEKSISFKKLAGEAYARGVPAVVTEWYNNTTHDVDPETGQGDAYATYCWATQMAEVEVDTETGKVEVLRIVAVTDVGKALNPLNCEAQIEGGVAQGLGYALEEEIKEEGGYVKTETLGEYMIPTSLDVPPIEVHLLEVAEPKGPYGAKGVGEPALIPTPPAVLNAVRDALGLRIHKLPANLENVYQLIHGEEAGN